VPSPNDGASSAGPSADGSFRAGLYRELLPLEAGNDTDDRLLSLVYIAKLASMQ